MNEKVSITGLSTPPRHQLLRIDREVIIDDIISQNK